MLFDVATTTLGKRPMKDNAILAAFVITILGGSGGTIFNIRSNNAVADKLDALTLKTVEIQVTLKNNDTDKARLEQEVRDSKDVIEHLRAEMSDVKSAIKVLEAKVK